MVSLVPTLLQIKKLKTNQLLYFQVKENVKSSFLALIKPAMGVSGKSVLTA
jgi:hypothetical protein